METQSYNNLSADIEASKRLIKNKYALPAIVLLSLMITAGAAHSIDMSNLAGIGGPLASTFVILGGLTPGIKALVAFLGFIVVTFTLIAIKNFSAVIFYVGLLIFLSVGLTVAGAMMGAMI